MARKDTSMDSFEKVCDVTAHVPTDLRTPFRSLLLKSLKRVDPPERTIFLHKPLLQSIGHASMASLTILSIPLLKLGFTNSGWKSTSGPT